MRQAAWLNTAPRRASKRGGTDEPISRRKKLQADGIEPDEPPIDAGAHLIEYLFEVGPDAPGAMGPVPITHADIAHWQGNTGIILNAWEARTLRRLSREYVGACIDAQEPDALPPYLPAEAVARRRAAVARNVAAALSGRGSARKES